MGKTDDRWPWTGTVGGRSSNHCILGMAEMSDSVTPGERRILRSKYGGRDYITYHPKCSAAHPRLDAS